LRKRAIAAALMVIGASPIWTTAALAGPTDEDLGAGQYWGVLANGVFTPAGGTAAASWRSVPPKAKAK
jgi:hypothetical protein